MVCLTVVTREDRPEVLLIGRYYYHDVKEPQGEQGARNTISTKAQESRTWYVLRMSDRASQAESAAPTTGTPMRIPRARRLAAKFAGKCGKSKRCVMPNSCCGLAVRDAVLTTACLPIDLASCPPAAASAFEAAAFATVRSAAVSATLSATLSVIFMPVVSCVLFTTCFCSAACKPGSFAAVRLGLRLLLLLLVALIAFLSPLLLLFAPPVVELVEVLVVATSTCRRPPIVR